MYILHDQVDVNNGLADHICPNIPGFLASASILPYQPLIIEVKLATTVGILIGLETPHSSKSMCTKATCIVNGAATLEEY